MIEQANSGLQIILRGFCCLRHITLSVYHKTIIFQTVLLHEPHQRSAQVFMFELLLLANMRENQLKRALLSNGGLNI